MISDIEMLEYITPCYSIIWSWLSLAALDPRSLPPPALGDIDPASLTKLDATALDSAWRRWARAEKDKRAIMAMYINDALIATHTRRGSHTRHFAITQVRASLLTAI